MIDLIFKLSDTMLWLFFPSLALARVFDGSRFKKAYTVFACMSLFSLSGWLLLWLIGKALEVWQ